MEENNIRMLKSKFLLRRASSNIQHKSVHNISNMKWERSPYFVMA